MTQITTRVHEQTHKQVIDMRAKFNDVKSTMDSARNSIHWADHIMEKVNIMGDIATQLNIEDLDPEVFVRSIHNYVDDYLKKLDKHVMTMERYGRL